MLKPMSSDTDLLVPDTHGRTRHGTGHSRQDEGARVGSPEPLLGVLGVVQVGVGAELVLHHSRTRRQHCEKENRNTSRCLFTSLSGFRSFQFPLNDDKYADKLQIIL